MASSILVGQPPALATLSFVGVLDMAPPVAAGTLLGQLTIAPEGWTGTVRLDGPDAELLTLDGTLRVLVGVAPLAEARIYQATAHANPGGSVEIAITVAGDQPIPPDPPDPPQPDAENSITLTNRSGADIVDYPFRCGRPFPPGKITRSPVLVGSDNQALPTQGDIKNRHDDGSAAFAIVAAVIPRLPAGESVTFTFGDGAGAGNLPVDVLAAVPDFDAALIVTGADGKPQSTSFRAALEAGLYWLWTSGPVAQTVTIDDDSAGRALDIGFADDGFRPLRPRAVATFWPQTGQVEVRMIGEAALTTELSDLAYTLEITAGRAAPETVYSADLLTGKKRHWAMTRWTRRFWLGGEPCAEVDIDWNLGYLQATGWVPNYGDIAIDPDAIDSMAALWTGRPHDIYDGQWNGGLWQNAMATTGERPEIGPLPSWDVLALYTGDARLREMQLGMSDLAGAFPMHFREGDPSKRLCRDDPAPAAGGVATGFGRTVALTDRKTFISTNLSYQYTVPADRITFVGPRDTSQPWTFDGAHLPQPFLAAYIVSGDPFYLDQAYLWAGAAAAMYNGANTTQVYGRGPTGAEGVIADQLRGAGWVMRSRAETVLMAPDDHPEKGYFATLARDAAARWEGGLGLTGTALDGDPSKTWGIKYGNYYSANGGPQSAKPPLLGNWEANGNPTSNPPVADVQQNEANGIFVPGAVGNWTSPWMQYYTLYGLGRALELGVPLGPLLEMSARWFTAMINESGFPQIVAMYRSPVEKRGGGCFDWPRLIGALEPNWLTGDGWIPPNSSCTSLPQYFDQNTYADGRQSWAIPGASYLVDYPGGAEAWAWLQENVIKPVGKSSKPFSTEPKWLIVPRAKNAKAVLPKIP